MTPKDYRELAEIIHRIPIKNQRNEVAAHFAESLKNRNERFDREKFLLACGYNRYLNEDDE